MDEDGWSAAVLAEPIGAGKFRPVLVVTRRRGDEVSDVAIPLDGEYDSRLAAEEAGKDALAAMARGQ
ncbi:hypothetical protein CDN98_06750 [Roseateles terrae]|nr:hypothetical protein CDN98_06750 [Roseateles terrae]